MQADFEFHITGLENAILNILQNGDLAANIPPMTNVNEFANYSGELDRENLLEAIRSFANRFPLVLVSYGSGVDKRKAATGMADKEPIENEHRCSFVVVVASDDLRGEDERRTSAYKMIAQVRKLIGGIQFEVESEDESESVLLNHAPMIPAGVECISRLKDLTAFAVHFTTMFHEWMPDRRVVPTTIEEIKLKIHTALPEEN